MAQKWEAVVGSTIYLVSGGALTYRLSAYGTGLPPVRRLTQRSPQQHGHTDLGFRYDARQLRLGFFLDVGSDDMADRRRDNLYEVWKALEATPIKLRVTRDDASIYQIDCYVADVLDMPDDVNDRLGSSQRFVVTLEAGDPMWYDPTQQSTTFSEADVLDWWLALGTITSGQVLEHVTTPTQGQSVDNSVSVGWALPWTVFFRTNVVDLAPVTYEFPFSFTSGPRTAYGALRFDANVYVFDTSFLIYSAFTTGEQSYFVSTDGGTFSSYRNADIAPIGTVVANGPIDGSDAATVWRSGAGGLYPWTPAISHGAIYNINLSQAQRAALKTATDFSYYASKTINYGGSFPDYPIITIAGPITDPVLTNVSTGEDLDFTGITIAGGDTYTIDCRFGYKTVKNAAGTNKIADLTAASDLATFHLGADPEVSGGANAFTLAGTGTDANTQVTVAYYNRYVGL